MPSYVRQSYDVIINGKGYLLARPGQTGRGQRSWRRRKPPKSDFRIAYGDVQQGELEGEFIVNFDNTPASGWGQQRRLRGGEGRYAYAQNVDARVPGQVILGPLVTAVTLAAISATAPNGNGIMGGFYEFTAGNSGKVYFAWGQFIVGITTSTMAVDAQEDLTEAADLNLANAYVRQVAVFDTYAHLAVANDSTEVAHVLVRQTADGDANFAKGNAGTEYDALCVSADSTGAVLYGAKREDSPSTSQIDKLPSGTAATTGTWTDNNVKIGDTGEICKWLVPYGYQIFAAMPNGFYGFDEALNSPNVLPELRNYRGTSNGLQAWQWHGSLWIPTARGLAFYNGSVGFAGPDVGTTVLKDSGSDHFGNPVSGCGDAEWQYVSYWNGSASGTIYIFAGREDDGSPTGLVWHPIIFLDTASQAAIGCMAITGQTTPPKLLLGRKGTVATALQHCMVSRAENPLQDPLYEYAASGTLYTSEHDCGVAGVSGTLEDITVSFTDVDADETLVVSYSMDHGTTWTQLRNSAGTAVTLNNNTSSPYVGYPVNDSTRVGETVQFKVAFARGSTVTKTPVLLSIKARVIKRYTRVQLIDCTTRIRDDLEDRNGNVCLDSGATLLSNLTDLEGGTTRFTVTDPLGTALTCLLHGDVQVDNPADMDDAYPELLATFRLRVLTV